MATSKASTAKSSAKRQTTTKKKTSSSKATAPRKGKPSSSYRARGTTKRTATSKTGTKGTVRKKAAARSKAKTKAGRSRSLVDILTSQVAVTLFFGFLIFAGFYLLFLRPSIERLRPCHGSKGYDICLPKDYAVRGFDISHHQGDIDWTSVATVISPRQPYPLQFVIVKATEGTDYTDRRFADNFAAAHAAGFICGAYHFYQPSSSAEAQAEHFIRTAPLASGDLPPVLDIETQPSLPLIGRKQALTAFQNNLLTFLQLLEEHYGVVPILYCSAKYRDHWLAPDAFDRYPLWVAHYDVEDPACEHPWTFWQHSDHATLPGITEKVDINVMRGSLKDLRGILIP